MDPGDERRFQAHAEALEQYGLADAGMNFGWGQDDDSVQTKIYGPYNVIFITYHDRKGEVTDVDIRGNSTSKRKILARFKSPHNRRN